MTQGNLLEATADALVNTVNCVGVMGKGIALQFKQAFPENFRFYEKACHAGEVQLGKMFIVPTESLLYPKFIINFPTKGHWKAKSRLKDIQTGLNALVSDILRLRIRSIALPPLGCGNGGLDWSDVYPLIKSAFEALPNVHIYVFAPSRHPESSSMPVTTNSPAMTRGRALLIRLMDIYREPSYLLGLLEIQKLAYFLQIAGEPLKLNFVK